MKSVIALVISACASSALAASIDGVYEGTIKVVKPAVEVPIVFSIKLTDDEGQTNSDEPFAVKKMLDGSFVVDGEGGPFLLTSSDFELGKGKLNLKYYRTGSNSLSNSIPSLRFECDLQADHTCAGTVYGQNGAFATFSISKKSDKFEILTATPKYVGHWKGKMTYNDLAYARLKNLYERIHAAVPDRERTVEFTLAPGDQLDTANPPTFELATTPKRIGNVWIDNDALTTFPFTTVVIDYFRRQIYLTYAPSPGTSTVQSTLSGAFGADGSIPKGVMGTSTFGQTATFSVGVVQ